ncbi:hypothetical protein DCC85_10170 [Paenibacillus sp. CAA11]|uniref:serine hydrolase domain-containing protein n=1 Tax=Paenibacillus sp. CAA11 TaxID=1532905 RepID=UPI000D34A0E5|nr:serine hydrolase domain-containing protein [Paenibacillus sp. CAA11]AWB44555.1 hypothetical protein DCC85_10170 [Paenibacillus sp. CAA11]
MQKEHKLLILKIVLLVFLPISVMDKNIYAEGGNLVPSKSTEFQLWLQQKAPQLQQRYGATGAAIGVVQGGETTYTLNMGYANKKDRIPVTTSTVFQAGSVSKTITALGILHLVDQGALSLDDPVSKYLTRWHFPSSPYDLEKVTVRSLLSHTAGLPAHPGYLGVKPGDKLSSLEESLSGLGESGVKTYVAQQPGKFAVYSGAGYTLLQLLIEEVTGLSFNTYMQQQILDPLGMISSSFDPSELNSGKAAGYGYFGQKLPITGSRSKQQLG